MVLCNVCRILRQDSAEIYLIPGGVELDIIINVQRCYSYRSVITVEFSRYILKICQIPNFMKIRLVGAELVHADGRTDTHDEANRRFSS
jgi:hypothetical protein